MDTKRFLALILLVFILSACQSAEPETPLPTDEAAEISAVDSEPTEIPATNTPPPPTMTYTPLPTLAAPASPTPLFTRTPLPTDTPTATPIGTDTPTPTDTPGPVPWDLLPWYWDPMANAPENPPPFLPPRPEIAAVPGAPTSYLSQYRLIGFYGSPEGRGLGVLGNQYRNETVRMIRATIWEFQPYVTDGRYSMPVFHMITTVAKPCSETWLPNCTYQVDLELIYDWLVTAENNNAAVTLDIQPGRGDVMEEFNRIRELLFRPHVLLAIDPEFNMEPDQVPNQQIGSLDASEINAIQAEMEQIALQIGVKRVLILHQFQADMITNKQDIINYPNVELVIDGDGYGPPGPKIRNYNTYAVEPGFDFGGFKIFSDQIDNQLIYDTPFMLPEQIMTVLVPPPVYIIYQ